MTVQRTRRGFLTASAAVIAATAGCLRDRGARSGDGSRVGSGEGPSETSAGGDRGTRSRTPASITCNEAIAPSFPTVEQFGEWNPDPPGDLTNGDARGYAASFEREYRKREIVSTHSGAYDISIFVESTPSIESTPGGHVVRLQMTAEYYGGSGEPEATHYSQRRNYEVTYYVTSNAVIRAENDEPVDPRDPDVGELLLCNPS